MDKINKSLEELSLYDDDMQVETEETNDDSTSMALDENFLENHETSVHLSELLSEMKIDNSDNSNQDSEMYEVPSSTELEIQVGHSDDSAHGTYTNFSPMSDQDSWQNTPLEEEAIIEQPNNNNISIEPNTNISDNLSNEPNPEILYSISKDPNIGNVNSKESKSPKEKSNTERFNEKIKSRQNNPLTKTQSLDIPERKKTPIKKTLSIDYEWFERAKKEIGDRLPIAFPKERFSLPISFERRRIHRRIKIKARHKSRGNSAEPQPKSPKNRPERVDLLPSPLRRKSGNLKRRASRSPSSNEGDFSKSEDDKSPSSNSKYKSSSISSVTEADEFNEKESNKSEDENDDGPSPQKKKC